MAGGGVSLHSFIMFLSVRHARNSSHVLVESLVHIDRKHHGRFLPGIRGLQRVDALLDTTPVPRTTARFCEGPRGITPSRLVSPTILTHLRVESERTVPPLGRVVWRPLRLDVRVLSRNVVFRGCLQAGQFRDYARDDTSDPPGIRLGIKRLADPFWGRK